MDDQYLFRDLTDQDPVTRQDLSELKEFVALNPNLGIGKYRMLWHSRLRDQNANTDTMIFNILNLLSTPTVERKKIGRLILRHAEGFSEPGGVILRLGLTEPEKLELLDLFNDRFSKMIVRSSIAGSFVATGKEFPAPTEFMNYFMKQIRSSDRIMSVIEDFI